MIGLDHALTLLTSSPERRRRLASTALWAAGALTACGGAQKAESAPSEPTYRESPTFEEAADDETLAETGPDCSDGTCFVCGDGSCPLGAYCDEGSGACAWLTECSGTPSCACLSRVLGDGCSCSESGGGPHVRCSP